jgi:hypothetical protein
VIGNNPQCHLSPGSFRGNRKIDLSINSLKLFVLNKEVSRTIKMFFILTYFPDPYNKFGNQNTTEETKITMAKHTRSAKKMAQFP